MRMSEQGIKELSLALSKFQGEVRNPHNEAVNPQFRSKYAPLDVVINTAKPVLAKHGLSFIQSTGTIDESITVTTLLIHESGEWIESDPLVLPAYQLKSGGAKEFNAQAIGSSLTYGRRYSLSAILGLSSEDDDDANGQVFGGGDSKSSSSKQTSTSSKPAEPSARDKAIAESKAKAEAKAKASEQNSAQKEETVSSGSAQQDEGSKAEGVEPISNAVLTAVNRMAMVLGKKRGKDFNTEEFLQGLARAKGKETLGELSLEQGKEVVAAINEEMRK